MPGFLADANPPAYNGYTFPNDVQTVQFDGESVVDEADRVTQYIRYRVALRFRVAVSDPAQNIDAAMAALKTTLMQRGGAFVYNNRGLGATFQVNTGSGVLDVDAGPKPISFSFKPAGKNQGCWVTWTVEICLPDQCSQVVAYQNVVMTFNYRLTIHIDQHGLTQRTYTGFFRIPRTANQIQIADDFLEQIAPQALYGFRCTSRDYNHSYDKTRMDFSVVHEEFPYNILPEGVVDGDASHTIRSSDRGPYNLDWPGVISATYSVAKGVPPEQAVIAFFKLAKSRLDFARKRVTFDGLPGDEKKPDTAPRIIVTGFEFSEPSIYNTQNVAVELYYQAITTLKGIFDATNGAVDGAGCGLWQPVGPDWDTWNASVIQGPQSPRGSANLILRASDDILVDLCAGSVPRPPAQVPRPLEASFIGEMIGDLQPERDEASSWFFYEPEIEIIEESHAVTSSSLPAEPWAGGGSPGSGQGSPGDWSEKGYKPGEKPGYPTDRVQQRAPSTLIIYLSGHAMRAWYEIPCPKIVEYQGNAVKDVSKEEFNCYFRTKQVGSLGPGMPIFYAQWRRRYVVEDRPSNVIKSPPSSYTDALAP